ncbi:MAG TPA: hypothetical protein C5S50_06545 [Methanosarcinaceae archaeon]|nr:hypothetical protein [Methanosarcinaceae archaeon]
MKAQKRDIDGQLEQYLTESRPDAISISGNWLDKYSVTASKAIQRLDRLILLFTTSLKVWN